ncbi:MAG: hypothetical protein R2867_45410 [Caldilineaceae bacterium]
MKIKKSLQNNQIQNRLATVGLTAELLQAGQEQVTALLTAKSQQTQRVGNARQRTKERNQAVKTLRRWLRDFVEIARIAFAGDPPLLAKLGPLVTNPARRAATTPAPAPEREAAAAPRRACWAKSLS